VTHLAAGVIVAIPLVVGILSIRHVVASAEDTRVTLRHTNIPSAWPNLSSCHGKQPRWFPLAFLAVCDQRL